MEQEKLDCSFIIKGVFHVRNPLDRHHLLWTRRKWRGGYAGKLRAFWYLRVPIPRATLHRHIHENMVGIPKPNELLCKSALEMLEELDRRGVLHKEDSIELRLKLLICMLDNGDSPTARALRKELELVESYLEQPP